MTDLKWWQKAVYYQIYPRSFADGNGDGIGDFQGMIDRLDYLKDLGIDALWLSPHYPSPYDDCGYDISDYTGVAPEYGTLEEFQLFLEGAHQRDIRVVLDLVLNHTSDQHPWFIESSSSRDNPKRDWYMWHDGVNGGPPNNWWSLFDGLAWEYHQTTEQYYYHFFLKEQPDLNWHNPEVKKAMWDAARFWLDLGVDGFRLDAIGTIFEDPAMPSYTSKLTPLDLLKARRTISSEEAREKEASNWGTIFQHQVEQPGVHELMQELRTLVDEYDDRVLVGENDDIAYHGEGNNELHMVYNFPLMRMEQLTPDSVRANQQERLSALPPDAWPCNTLGNHDVPRVYSQFGDGKNDAALARISLALMLTLRGTPFLYYGEEIGMTNYLFDDVSLFRDTPNIWLYNTMITQLGKKPEEALQIAASATRDRCRTPMQWSDAANGGFSPSGVETWLPVNQNFNQGVNVSEQLDDPTSMLNFYQRMLSMRKQTPALLDGEYIPFHEEAEDYLAFLRKIKPDGQTCLVVLNMSGKSHTLEFGDSTGFSEGTLIFSSHPREGDIDNLDQLPIAPFEVYVAELT